MGVDVSDMRLNATVNVLRKYGLCLPKVLASNKNWDLALFRCDGRTFDADLLKSASSRGTLKWNTRANEIFCGGKLLALPRKRPGKLKGKIDSVLAEDVVNKPYGPLFDRVLVDAECTTDGRHAVSGEQLDYKRAKRGDGGVISSEEMQSTEALQLDLLRNGFRLLKSGGVLIYSTCSMLEGQNEGVLSKFMTGNSLAQLVPPFVVNEDNIDQAGHRRILPPFSPSRTLGNLAWRLTPAASGTSGLFISKIVKM